MDTTTRHLGRCTRALLLTAALLLTLCAPLSAQDLCADDAGGACEDDAGTAAPADGGTSASPDGGATGSGPDAGSAGPDVACSCETDLNDADDRIHVCTESRELDVCSRFECERGTVRSRTCTTRSVALCCSMPTRGLTTLLYEDCTHPNCESGFREQCRSFSGTVSEGADCTGPEVDGDDVGSDDDESSGFCAVARVGRRAERGAHGGAALAALAAVLLFTRRVRRCRSRAARARCDAGC